MLLLCFLNSLFTGGVVKVNGLALSVKSYGFASSPKVGALGSPRKVHLFAKASPFGRGGCEQSEQTERARTLPLSGQLYFLLIMYIFLRARMLYLDVVSHYYQEKVLSYHE